MAGMQDIWAALGLGGPSFMDRAVAFDRDQQARIARGEGPLSPDDPMFAQAVDIAGAVGPNDLSPWSGLGLGGIIRAYHGTGAAPFERFNDQYIGKGQGAATYGVGHYLAENLGVAEDYRRSLAAPELTIGGRPARTPDETSIAIQIAHGTKPKDKISDLNTLIETLERNIKKGEAAGKPLAPMYYGKLQGAKMNRDAWYNISEQEVKLEENPGTLLTADVDVEPEDLLDWDLPLSKQPEKVRKSLEGLGFTKEELGPEYDSLTGEQIYQRAKPFLGSPAKASKALHEAGIPGLRYLDQGSRDAGEGTRNLVMFDPELIKILEAKIGGLGTKF